MDPQDMAEANAVDKATEEGACKFVGKESRAVDVMQEVAACRKAEMTTAAE